MQATQRNHHQAVDALPIGTVVTGPRRGGTIGNVGSAPLGGDRRAKVGVDCSATLGAVRIDSLRELGAVSVPS